MRTVHQGDALAWLKSQELKDCSFVTSLPDFSETSSLTLQTWKDWFQSAAGMVIERCPANGVIIFFQTDIKHEGTWVDKAFLIQKAAEEKNVPLLWHKIICRVPPGQVTFGRPAYAHLLCFSKEVRAQIKDSTLDVLPDGGEKTWTRGMGVEVCRLACRFIQSHTDTRTVVDPFCGHGMVLAVANEMGMEAIGVELGPKRARKARNLQTNEIASPRPQ